MEEVIAIAIGVLAASGTWLVLRPRTFQVVMAFACCLTGSTCSFSAWAACSSAKNR